VRRGALPVAFLLLFAVAYQRALQSQGAAAQQLAPGVFWRLGDKDIRQPANTSWIEFRDFVVVIEANTPWGIRAILPEIKKTTTKPIRYVFDTHYHWDHTQGNSVMADQACRWSAHRIAPPSLPTRAGRNGIRWRRGPANTAWRRTG